MRAPSAPVVLGGILLGIALFVALARLSASFDPEEAGLGANTVARSATFDGIQVADRALGGGSLAGSVSRLRVSGHRVALWLGASQLHGVNRFAAPDELAVWHANAHARARGSDLRYVQLSLPNANLNELLAIYLWFRHASAPPPDWLVVAMTYDDLREPGVRSRVLDALPPLPAAWDDDGAGIRNLAAALADRERHAPVQRTATSGTPQERLERELTTRLEALWAPYAERTKVHGLASFELRRRVAQLLGGVGSRRAPPVPEDLQRWNEAALDTLLRLARHDGVRVLLYRAPHPQYPGPFHHDRVSYDAFHSWMERHAGDGVFVEDFETLVPVEHWGTTNEGRPDMFHFTGDGHARLGQALDEAVGSRGDLALQ